MAKRKRRPKAGPPPVHNPRKAAAATQAKASGTPQRRKGEPVPPSVKGVLIRAAFVAAVFYPVLVFLLGEPPAAAAIVVLIAFGVMLPFGLWMDRFRYRREMRRWEERHGGSARR